MAQRVPDKRPVSNYEFPANDNREVARLTSEQVESVESNFERGVEVADKDLDKWTMMRVQLREIGMHMANEQDYHDFLIYVKKMLGQANLQTVGILLRRLIENKSWSGSYKQIMEKLLAEKPQEDSRESAIRLSEIVRAMDTDIINSPEEALIKIELAKEQGLSAIDQLNYSLQEYEAEYARRYEGKFSKQEFMSWLAEAARLGDMDLADEMETYLANQFSVHGDKPELAKRNIRETLDIMAKLKASERSGFMRRLNDSEQGYIVESGKKPADKKTLN